MPWRTRYLRSCRIWQKLPVQKLSVQDAPTSRTRSITLSHFPGIFKGALEGRATQITEEMKLAAANAIAGLVPEEELNENNILPEAFDPRVAETVSKAIKDLI